MGGCWFFAFCRKIKKKKQLKKPLNKCAVFHYHIYIICTHSIVEGKGIEFSLGIYVVLLICISKKKSSFFFLHIFQKNFFFFLSKLVVLKEGVHIEYVGYSAVLYVFQEIF